MRPAPPAARPRSTARPSLLLFPIFVRLRRELSAPGNGLAAARGIEQSEPKPQSLVGQPQRQSGLLAARLALRGGLASLLRAALRAALRDFRSLLGCGLTSRLGTGLLSGHFRCLLRAGDMRTIKPIPRYVARRILPPIVMCQRKKFSCVSRVPSRTAGSPCNGCGPITCLVVPETGRAASRRDVGTY